MFGKRPPPSQGPQYAKRPRTVAPAGPNIAHTSTGAPPPSSVTMGSSRGGRFVSSEPLASTSALPVPVPGTGNLFVSPAVDRGCPSSPESEIDVLSLGPSEGDDMFPGMGQEPVLGEREQQSPLGQEVITRAALNIDLPLDQGPAPSYFDDEAGGQSTHFLIPLLSDFEEVVRNQFQTPSVAARWSGLCRRLASVHERGRIGCGPLPPVDQALASLVSPSRSVLEKSSCPSKNCKMMDALLAKMHGAMAVQTQLTNTGAILALYQHHLVHQLKEECSAELITELHKISSLLSKLMKEQSEAAGKAMSGLWGVSPCCSQRTGHAY